MPELGADAARVPLAADEAQWLRARLRRLPRGDVLVRPVVEGILRQWRSAGRADVPAVDVARLSEQLRRSPSGGAANELGAWLLARAPIRHGQREAAVTGLVTALLGVGRERDSERLPRRALAATLVVSVLLGCLVAGVQPAHGLAQWLGRAILAAVVVEAVSCVALYLLYARGNPAAPASLGGERAHIAAAGALGRIGGPRAVGALAWAARHGPEETGRAARHALERVLPRLTEADRGQAGGLAVPALGACLGSVDEPLELLVLDALAKIGDARAMPAVADAATGGRTDAARLAAGRALAAIRRRVEPGFDASRLVRPSDAPPEHLVKPASGPGATVEQALLRPGPAEEDGEEGR